MPETYDTALLIETKFQVSPAGKFSILATAAGRIYDVFAALRDRAMVDDAEMLRLVYRFAGEVVDVEEMLRRGSAAGIPTPKKES